jgi:hypothetical protein
MPLEGKTDEEIRALDEQLLTRVRDNGGKASNPKLMQQLGWPADDYWPIRQRKGRQRSHH